METFGDHRNPPGSDAQADGSDQRGAERLRLLMRTGKLVTSKGEFLCVLRDASTTGFRAKIYHPLPDVGQMQLELASELRYDVEKVWENESEAGFRFEREIELEELINELTPYPKRGVRLKLALDTSILVGVEKASAKIFNLSQQGARIKTSHPLARDQRLRLEIKGLRTVAAQVRWRNEDTYGLVFDDTFRFDELALHASRLQRTNGLHQSGQDLSRNPQIEAAG